NKWTDSHHITVKGLRLRAAANFAQRGGVVLGRNWRMEDCTVEWNNAGGIAVNGDNAVVLRCLVQDCGFTGLGGGCSGFPGLGDSCKDVLVQDCTVRRCNRKGFDVGWDGG